MNRRFGEKNEGVCKNRIGYKNADLGGFRAYTNRIGSLPFNEVLAYLSAVAINGRVKEEKFSDSNIGGSGEVPKAVREYIDFLNERRPSFAIGYLTPAQY